MSRSVLPPFSCVLLFLDLALVIQLGLWKGKLWILTMYWPWLQLFLSLLGGCLWEAKAPSHRISPCFFSQIIMASPSPIAHPSCSCDHSPALFPLFRRSTQVPVDQESGSRVWDLQLACQGAFIPC